MHLIIYYTNTCYFAYLVQQSVLSSFVQCRYCLLSKIDRSCVVVRTKGKAIGRLANQGIVALEGKSGSTSRWCLYQALTITVKRTKAVRKVPINEHGISANVYDQTSLQRRSSNKYAWLREAIPLFQIPQILLTFFIISIFSALFTWITFFHRHTLMW